MSSVNKSGDYVLMTRKLLACKKVVIPEESLEKKNRIF